jgi:hypothetical protein
MVVVDCQRGHRVVQFLSCTWSAHRSSHRFIYGGRVSCSEFQVMAAELVHRVCENQRSRRFFACHMPRPCESPSLVLDKWSDPEGLCVRWRKQCVRSNFNTRAIEFWPLRLGGSSSNGGREAAIGQPDSPERMQGSVQSARGRANNTILWGRL